MNSKYLGLSTKNGFKVFKEDNILYALSEGNYTEVYLIDNQRIMSSKNLKEFEDTLSPKSFCRIHHSHIINLNYLVEYRNSDKNFVVMKDGKQLDVSKRKTSEFLDNFKKI